MAVYLEACLKEAGDDAAFIAAALGDIARAKGMTQLARETLGAKASTRHFPARESKLQLRKSQAASRSTAALLRKSRRPAERSYRAAQLRSYDKSPRRTPWRQPIHGTIQVLNDGDKVLFSTLLQM